MDFDMIGSMYMSNRIHFIGKDVSPNEGERGGTYLVFLSVVGLFLRVSQRATTIINVCLAVDQRSKLRQRSEQS